MLKALIVVLIMFGAVGASLAGERGGRVHHAPGGNLPAATGHPGGSQGHAGVWRHHDAGRDRWAHRNDDFAAGVLGGIIGGLAGKLFAPDPEPPPVVVVEPPAPTAEPYPPWTPEWYDMCNGKYKSFDAKTGYYTGFDGVQHFCN